MTLLNDKAYDPVLIAGAGPVGLTLAIELGMRGIRCILVERRDGTVKLPKMSGVTSRGMEICRRWGISGEVRRAGIPEDHPGDLVYFTQMTGPELARWLVPPPTDPRRLSFTPEPPCKCAQIFFDPILARFTRTLPSIEQRYDTALEAFTQDDLGVTATLVSTIDGRRETVRASYLVGCDGPASLVRDTLGIELEGLGLVAKSVSIFFKSAALAGVHKLGWAHVYRSIDAKGCWAEMIPISAGGMFKLTLFDVGASTQDPAACLRRFVGTDFPFEIVAATPWDRRDYLARSYGRGRVFIAGDSCHECSPTGGLGMHTGIEEALNLAWKLAAMIEGWGGPHLLSSYEAERHPIARRNVALATKSFTSIQAIPGFDPYGGRPADDWQQELKARLAQYVVTEFQKLQYCYEGSPVCEPDGTSPIAEDELSYTPSARPGTRAPHFWIADGRSVLDELGFGFTLLRLGPAPPGAGMFIEAAGTRRIPLQIVSAADPRAEQLYDATLALIRPDGHVGWRGRSIPVDAGAIFDRLRGAVTP